jgi:small-conductance mechanosensitive channel
VSDTGSVSWASSLFLVTSTMLVGGQDCFNQSIICRQALFSMYYVIVRWATGVLNSEKVPFHLLHIKRLLLKPWNLFLAHPIQRIIWAFVITLRRSGSVSWVSSLFLVTSTMLVEVRDCRTQFWKGNGPDNQRTIPPKFGLKWPSVIWLLLMVYLY